MLANYLLEHPFGDIDRGLLSDDESLRVESVSYGSWIGTFRAKAKEAIHAVTALVTIVFPRTRDMFLRKLEAETSLKEIEAKRGAVALERERFELVKAQADYALELVKRLDETDAKDVVQRRLREAIYDLAAGDTSEGEIRSSTRRLLPLGPSKDIDDDKRGS